MNFNKLIKHSSEGINKNIYSRRDDISVSIELFDMLSKKYFHSIKKGQNLNIEYDENDKQTLIFILRWYYNLWIYINKNQIRVYSNFPKEFKIIKEVNKSNHPHTPKTFKKGTKMIFSSSKYSTCNWLRGIPLWDNKEDRFYGGLKPSCQINYEYVKPRLV